MELRCFANARYLRGDSLPVGNRLSAIVACWVVLVSIIGSAPSLKADAPPPNIVMIFTDDQGYNDVGCFGSEIDTPNIDRIAKQGMRLTQFYAASSICTPSRYGLLTGQFSHRSKDQLLSALMFLTDEDKHRGIRPGEETYVSKLRQAGYRTALVGKWHLGHGEDQFWPTRHGFDSFFGHTGGCVDFFTLQYGNQPDWYRGRKLVKTDDYATDVITTEAISVLRESAKSKRPLYLHLSYNAPHFGKGWNKQQQSPENIMQPKPADLKKVAHIRDPLRRAFAAKVVGLDKSIGELMDTLDELAMSDNTLLIFMTDHGGDSKYGGSNVPFRGGKATLYEGGIRVPCIVRWPGKIQPGSVNDSVACAIDWAATLAEVVGFDSSKVDGVSMMPILRGESSERRKPLVWKTGAHAELKRQSWIAVRDQHWKWIQAPGEQPQLFDLERDPEEKSNLAADHPDVASRLSAIGSQN